MHHALRALRFSPFTPRSSQAAAGSDPTIRLWRRYYISSKAQPILLLLSLLHGAFDLAAIYGVSTKVLNQAVQRNPKRFPKDFSFFITPQEVRVIRSQIVTGSQSHRNPRYRPRAFTEHGAIMAATVLKSPRAVQMSLFVVRAFVKMRQMLVAQNDLAEKLSKLEEKLTDRLDVHETAIVEVLQQVMILLTPSPPEPEPPRHRIGFQPDGE